MDKLRQAGYIVEEVDYNVFKAYDYDRDISITFDLNTGRYWSSDRDIDTKTISSICVELGLK